MELTNEQLAIIQSKGNIKINAVAGSGKTTTIIEYARSRPKSCKILYIVFNKSIKFDSEIKFSKLGLSNVKVETAHALAYKNIVFKHNYKVRGQGYKTNEIAEILQLQGNGEKHTEFVIANHVSKYAAYFCNSNKPKVQDLNYLDIVYDAKAKAFVKSFYTYIQSQTRLFLSKMDKGEIEVTHDFYLKKFQLSNPNLSYDFILFDEGQDASPAMLDIFLKQKATKVIVGDTHQQIYGWRFAINSLENVDFKNYFLTTSFRFNQHIANLAIKTLDFKSYVDVHDTVSIIGKGNASKITTKAVIARTNLGLLLKAISYITERKKITNIYFEGNIHSYTYADEGASLYDVLNLYNGKIYLIRDSIIKTMKDLGELKEYVKNTEDAQLGMMIDIVEEYGDKIPEIIKELKQKHVGEDQKHTAQMIFSTVHRSKGMEYDAVHLVEDFITEEKLEKYGDFDLLDDAQISKINEEINLLYVAITRTKNSIYIPETLLPVDFESAPNIHVLKVTKPDEKQENNPIENKNPKSVDYKTEITKTYSVNEVQNTYKDTYKPWSEQLDAELTRMYYDGIPKKDLAKHFGRTSGAISARVEKLQLDAI